METLLKAILDNIEDPKKKLEVEKEFVAHEFKKTILDFYGSLDPADVISQALLATHHNYMGILLKKMKEEEKFIKSNHDLLKLIIKVMKETSELIEKEIK